MKYFIYLIIISSNIVLASSPKEAKISEIEVSGTLPELNQIFSVSADTNENGDLNYMAIIRGTKRFEASDSLLKQATKINLESLVVSYEHDAKELRTYLYIQFCYEVVEGANKLTYKREYNQYTLTITPDNKLLYDNRPYCRL